MPPRDPTLRKRLKAAAAWRVRLDAAGAETSPEHQSWLAADRRNREAWKETLALWRALEAAADAPEMRALRSQALARARPSRPRRPAWRVPVAIAATVLVCSGLGLLLWRALDQPAYASAHGQRRIVSLADNSAVILDSDSLIRVRYEPHARRLELVRGRARFDVAQDPARPFSVRAGDRAVVATGTSFEVELEPRAVRVILISGRVEVRPAPAGPSRGDPPAVGPAVQLSPGEQLTAREGAPATVSPVDLSHATAWESGKLVFDDTPLAEAAREVSRYTDKPVTTGDARAAALRLSGVFKAGDLSTFVDAVTRYLPVRSDRLADGVVLRSDPPP